MKYKITITQEDWDKAREEERKHGVLFEAGAHCPVARAMKREVKGLNLIEVGNENVEFYSPNKEIVGAWLPIVVKQIIENFDGEKDCPVPLPYSFEIEVGL